MFTKNKGDATGLERTPRGPGRPRGRTRQGEERRAELYRAAVALFAERGFAETTMRDIAEHAGVSPGLLYRYFPSKRAVVMELHETLSADFARAAEAMPRGRWRERFLFGVRTSLAVLGPHRETLEALVPLLVGRGEAAVLSPSTVLARERVEGAFVEAVLGASDAPPEAHARPLGRVLYLAHLGVLLFWLLDRSPGHRATDLLLAFAEKALAPIALALRLAPTRRLLAQLDAAASAALFADEPAPEAAP